MHPFLVRLARSRPAVTPRVLQSLALTALLAAGACSDTTGTTAATAPRPATPPAGELATADGAFEVRFTGVGTAEQTASIVPLGGATPSSALRAADRLPGASSGAAALAPENRGLTLRVGALAFSPAALASGSYIYGARNASTSYRYVYGIFRVRNTTGAPLTNAMLMATHRPSHSAGTAFNSITLGNGTVLTGSAADSRALAMMPAGASHPGHTGVPVALRADVLQIFSEADIAAIASSLPTSPQQESALPYAFSVIDTATWSNSSGGRTLQPTADGNFPGLVFFAFKVPLDPVSGLNDVFAFSFYIRPVTDAETRLTQSLEEQDATSASAVSSRANTIGAANVHVLRGSSLTGLPTTRNFCAVRTAGTQAAPTALLGTSCASEVTNFTVSPLSVTLSVGATQQLLSELTPGPGCCTWSGATYASANRAVATVSAGGLVTAVAPGTTTIYVGPNGRGTLLRAVPVTVQ